MLKKREAIILIAIACILLLSACNNKIEPGLAIGNYVMEESDEIIKPTVTLKENKEFIFNYSILSSYFANGTYEEDGSNLILKTGDGKYKYVFEIKDNTLNFNEKESSEISSYAESAGAPLTKNVLDGSIFVLDKNDNIGAEITIVDFLYGKVDLYDKKDEILGKDYFNEVDEILRDIKVLLTDKEYQRLLKNRYLVDEDLVNKSYDSAGIENIEYEKVSEDNNKVEYKVIYTEKLYFKNVLKQEKQVTENFYLEKIEEKWLIYNISRDGNSNDYWIIGMEPSKILSSELNTIDGISLVNVNYNLDNKEIYFTLENKTNNTIYFGEYITLEKKHKDNWYSVPYSGEVGFTDILNYLEVQSQSDRNLPINAWAHILPGDYRIIKEVFLDDNTKNPHFISADFTIPN